MSSEAIVNASYSWIGGFDSYDENFESDDVFLEQFVVDVLDFSSQYGSDISISYTAYNISGKPSKFPDYGDFPQTFVMRTYGKWWNDAPSCPLSIMPQNNGPIQSQDYIDISFEQKVYPEAVCIYETYNPGSVVRIWAGDNEGLWKLLWEGEPQIVEHGPRIFCPKLKKIDFMTCLIRLEFDHSRLDYYTELDAVKLSGSRTPNTPVDLNNISSQVKDLKLNTITNDIDMSSALTSLVLLSQQYNALIEDINLEIESPTSHTSGPFDDLPDETILRIFSYLDLTSLCRCVQVNKHFNRLASDTMLYTAINLKPMWHCIRSKTLQYLTPRCKYLQKLNLSWCGSYGAITSSSFITFIKNCGKQLTHLQLNCCKYIDNDCIKQISETCCNLKELTLRNCCKISKEGFEQLVNITTFQRLDLYRTAIEAEPLIKILKHSPKLQHINLGSCVNIASMDEVAQALGTYNRELISVDLWKTYSLTPVGVKALSNCSKLEEIDFGWCLGVSIPGDSMLALANGCRRLKKLFMAALRGITDRDMYPFISNCPRLQQIDLLGIRSITPQICVKFLTTLKELRLFDISFCDQIHDNLVQEWRQQFPHVSIKRSFQSDGTYFHQPY